MRLAKIRLSSGEETVGLIEAAAVVPLALSGGQIRTLSDILEDDDPHATARLLVDEDAERLSLNEVTLLAPVDNQEIWAAGVTYRRSKTARMDESDVAGLCYDRVYEADRPELFFKATPRRVVGPGMAVRIRQDSTWNVPEPELTLVLSSRMRLVGYTIGNDVSSRDIEGENPLYLPQAKVYDGCCGLGPCVTLVPGMPVMKKVGIALVIRRGGELVFEGKTDIGQMARPFDNLIEYLGRDNTFPDGVMLLTGTGIVPGDEFTLVADDVVEITIDGIGTLTNTVMVGQRVSSCRDFA